MTVVMVAHAVIGATVVSSGALAILSRKGSTVHSLAGHGFVGALLLMGPVVAAGGWLSPGSISPLGILFTAFMTYLALSAWSTIHQPEARLTPLDFAAPLLALCLSVAGLMLGFDAFGSPGGLENTAPKEACFFFSALACVAMLLDINHLRVGGVRGKHRIIRHVWRMGCALFFATSTLFTGPGAIVLPEPVRGHLLLNIPQLLVVVLTLYWLYRLHFVAGRRPGSIDTSTQPPESQYSTNHSTEID